MKRTDLIACLRNSAAMLLIADNNDPDIPRREACHRANAGQAGILRYVADRLEAGEQLED